MFIMVKTLAVTYCSI